MTLDLIKFTQTVGQSIEEIEAEVEDYKKAHSGYNKDKLADGFCNSLLKMYTSVGVAGALPSVIPGLGTAAQVATELGTISADVILMLRWMYKLVISVGIIYGRDVRNQGTKDFIATLGLWCGVLKYAQPAIARITGKVAENWFKKNVSGKILKKVNTKVSTTIVTKYGTKRGGIALGKLIPFGVGAAVGGTFNYLTMRGFKHAALRYYSTDQEIYFEE